MRALLGFLLVLSLVLTAACKRKQSEEATSDSSSQAPVTKLKLVAEEPELIRLKPGSEIRYTNQQVDGMLVQIASNPKDRYLTQLIPLLVRRASAMGRVEDYSTAVEVAEKLIELYPDGNPNFWLTRGRVYAAVHRFDEAKADLAEARKRGANPRGTDELDATIALALDDAGRARRLHQHWNSRLPHYISIATEAIAASRQGETELADALFRTAIHRFQGVDPFAYAWLLFQRGLNQEEAGNLAAARKWYEAGHERMPIYAQMTAHLAAIVAKQGDTKRAIEIVRPLLETSTDPEYRALLGKLLIDSGEKEEGEKLVAEADRGYRELLKVETLAFADHAARFWLGVGDDPALAHFWAKKSLEARPTDKAMQLALDAALAASAYDDACSVAERASRRENASAYLLFAAAKAMRKCNRTADATALMNRAEKAKRDR